MTQTHVFTSLRFRNVLSVVNALLEDAWQHDDPEIERCTAALDSARIRYAYGQSQVVAARNAFIEARIARQESLEAVVEALRTVTRVAMARGEIGYLHAVLGATVSETAEWMSLAPAPPGMGELIERLRERVRILDEDRATFLRCIVALKETCRRYREDRNQLRRRFARLQQAMRRTPQYAMRRAA